MQATFNERVKFHHQGSLSYTRMRELLLKKLSQVGMDPKKFGLHKVHVCVACLLVHTVRLHAFGTLKVVCPK